jgi:hypothetical protein
MKAQSQIISVVLLILLVIAATAIIYSFVLPFISDQLDTGDCVNVQTKIEIEDNPKYTCYDSDANTLRVQIKIQNVNSSISGFIVELGGASTKSLRITSTEHEGVLMYGGEAVDVPGNNEARTYNLTSTEKPEYVRVYGILNNGEVCGLSDSIIGVDLNEC